MIYRMLFVFVALFTGVVSSAAEAEEKISHIRPLLKIAEALEEEKFISSVLKLDGWSILKQNEFRVWIIRDGDTSNYAIRCKGDDQNFEVSNGDWIKKYKMVSKIEETSKIFKDLVDEPILFSNKNEAYISASLKSTFIIEYYHGSDYKWAIRKLRKIEIEDYNKMITWSGLNIPNLNIGWAVSR
jgi:hypothetical protein